MEPATEHSELTIKMHNLELANLHTTKTYSKVYFLKEMPWYLEIFKNKLSIPKLIVNLLCNADDKGEHWFCVSNLRFKICNRNDAQSWIAEGGDTMWAKSASLCIPFSWDVICDPNNGFSVDGRISIEVSIRVEEVYGVRRKYVNFDFSAPGPGTDVILVVEGREIHVAKAYLTQYSTYFASMFYGQFKESKEGRIELPGESYEGFIALLNLIYPHDKTVTFPVHTIADDNYEQLLHLAQYYDVRKVKEAVEKFLMNCRIKNKTRLLQIAEEYQLDVLKAYLTWRSGFEKEDVKVINCPVCEEEYVDGGRDVIGCDCCDSWFHFPCERVSEKSADKALWFCKMCKPRHGQRPDRPTNKCTHYD